MPAIRVQVSTTPCTGRGQSDHQKRIQPQQKVDIDSLSPSLSFNKVAGSQSPTYKPSSRARFGGDEDDDDLEQSGSFGLGGGLSLVMNANQLLCNQTTCCCAPEF